MTEVPRVYWDANVFLSYVDGDSERLPDIEALIAQAEREEVEIITSTISITEVAFGSVEQDRKALDSEIQAKIARLWDPSSPTKLVEVSVLVVEEAREVMRSALPQGLSPPKPIDAIHLCTARRMEVANLHTYDDKMQKWAERIGIVSTEPKVSSPRLPME